MYEGNLVFQNTLAFNDIVLLAIHLGSSSHSGKACKNMCIFYAIFNAKYTKSNFN